MVAHENEKDRLQPTHRQTKGQALNARLVAGGGVGERAAASVTEIGRFARCTVDCIVSHPCMRGAVFWNLVISCELRLVPRVLTTVRFLAVGPGDLPLACYSTVCRVCRVGPGRPTRRGAGLAFPAR